MDYWKFSTITDGSSSTSIRTTSELTTFYADGTAGYYVEAYGPIVRRSDGDPEWSSATGSSSAPSSSDASSTRPTSGTTAAAAASTTESATNSAQSNGGGLSTGAKAGIGVGVALGAIVLIGCVVAAYMIGKKRRREAAAAAPGPGPDVRTYGKPAPGQAAEMPDSAWGGSYYARQELGEGRPGLMSEMESREQPAELHG